MSGVWPFRILGLLRVFVISTVGLTGPKSALESDCGPAASLLAAGVSAGGPHVVIHGILG